MVKLNLTQLCRLDWINLSLAVSEVFRNSKSSIINSYDMVHAQAFPFPPHSPIIEIPEDFVDNKNCFLMQNFLVL